MREREWKGIPDALGGAPVSSEEGIFLGGDWDWFQCIPALDSPNPTIKIKKKSDI